MSRNGKRRPFLESATKAKRLMALSEDEIAEMLTEKKLARIKIKGH